MSLQMCHCGWSKVTTHHGLRTHQGKMGCTPKGMHIPRSELLTYIPISFKGTSLINVKDPSEDIFRTSLQSGKIFEHNSSDKSLQTCHCGWSKVTTYHGLRTHQGKMGCTPKGMRIPQSESSGYISKSLNTPSQITLEDNSTDTSKTTSKSEKERKESTPFKQSDKWKREKVQETPGKQTIKNLVEQYDQAQHEGERPCPAWSECRRAGSRLGTEYRQEDN
ncbi:uncharacterized protein LOC119779446 [Cyprinodon tularosa]|uniref:uncharacterized protein LOC119779446 n=1 Tax=Cyprinodon tularosa TaxID=77115 RepID=UPI0018E2810D|nr:uncharacterized protein LOC119779446 [Cyprinodon tularosa]